MIGAGKWSHAYIRTLASIEGMNLVRIARKRNERDDLPPNEAEITTDWKAVAMARDLDGVIIATPPVTHGVMAIEAMKCGLPVLVEKPVTLDIREARAVLSVAESEKAIIRVDHTHLYSAAYRKMKEIAPSLGSPLKISSYAGKAVIRRELSVLWDWGPHDIAMCLDLLGEMPKRREGRVVERKHLAEGTGETIEISLTFPGSGSDATIRLSTLVADRVRRFMIHGRGGLLLYDDLAPHKLIRPGSFHDIKSDPSIGDPVAIDGEPPLAVAVKEFGQAIRSADRDLSSLRLGVSVVEVLHDCELQLSSL